MAGVQAYGRLHTAGCIRQAAYSLADSGRYADWQAIEGILCTRYGVIEARRLRKRGIARENPVNRRYQGQVWSISASAAACVSLASARLVTSASRSYRLVVCGQSCLRCSAGLPDTASAPHTSGAICENRGLPLAARMRVENCSRAARKPGLPGGLSRNAPNAIPMVLL
jgi:hypothetical protein